MKNRILQFVGSFRQGGSELQSTALAAMLKREGPFDVSMATLDRNGVLLADLDTFDRDEIPEFPLTSFYNPNFVRQVRRCSKYLRENQIDLVHTHDFYTNVFGMAAASLAGIPARVASKRETGGMRSRSQEFIEKIAFGRADAITANSVAVRDYLIHRGISAEKIEVIYNGVDMTRFANEWERAAVCAKYNLPSGLDKRFITLVANLRHSVKNIPMLLQAAKRVTDEIPHVHFVIAGEGKLKNGLMALSGLLGVSANVHFIGRCADVPGLLSVASACVLTSTNEGFSNSILEYMAAGKPVVATKVGGADEVVVDGETGYLVPSGDDKAMAQRLIEILNDEEKAVRFGSTAMQIVAEKFSREAQLANTIELYHSLLNR
ncbi:MAG: glycosyltransferase [Pyrinomonadaceae bacterium]